jgi:hypothetical protein
VKGGANTGGFAVGSSGAICEGGGEAGTESRARGGTGIDAASGTEFGARVSGG